MCDYSLEAFKTVPADVGVTYELKQAVSGSKGFFKDNKLDMTSYAEACAACVTEGSLLRIEIPEAMQYEHGVTAIEDVIFVQRDLNGHTYAIYRDGVRLQNGTFHLLQAFPVGTRATVLMLADADAPADRELASPEPATWANGLPANAL